MARHIDVGWTLVTAYTDIGNDTPQAYDAVITEQLLAGPADMPPPTPQLCCAPFPVDFCIPVECPTPTPGLACFGDCNGDGVTTVDEILLRIDIALGNADASSCSAVGPSTIGIQDLIQAVSDALVGCPP